ncbi:hypothetical protein GCM10009809_00300 [Isoptericola hypogeus]|uniref:Trypsin-co-occurring domain-containing protein n=1 Tax=Isoptericola hypogeus TaxID=300179 RepID=A0ABN2IMB4_9MICO
MPQIIEFPLEGGGSLLVAGDAGRTDTVTRGGASTRVVQQAQQSFEAAVASVRPAAEVLLRQMRDLGTTPETIQVEFGVQLTAAAGAIIAAAEAQANFRVTLTWRAGQGAGQSAGQGPGTS